MSEDNEETRATDLSATFYTHFQTKKSEITARLEAIDASSSISSDTTTTTQTAEFTSISSEILNLRKDLVDATPYLPTYDRGKCEQQLRVLEEALSRYKAPKAKFTFKRKPASTTSHAPPPPPPPPPPNSELTKQRTEKPPMGESAAPSTTTNITLSSRSSAHLTLASLVRPADVSPSQPTGSSRSSDITLTDIKHCIVNLLPSPSLKGERLVESRPTLTITALHAKALSRVVLIMPPIEGSVLLHEIHNSIVIIGCHQFRMHNSTNTTVLLHVLSQPIIEHSKGIQFGAYPASLCRAPPQKLPERPSNHSMVQDFDWIKPSPSPNWSVLDSSALEERLVQVVNEDNGAGGIDVESVLKEVL